MRRPGGVTILFASLAAVLGVLAVENIMVGTSQPSPLRIIAGVILGVMAWCSWSCALESDDMDQRNGR